MPLIHRLVGMWKSIAVAMLGTIASCLVCLFGSLDVQIAFSGSLISLIAGLLVEAQSLQSQDQLRHFEILDAVGIPSLLAKRTDLYKEFLGLRRAFANLIRFENPLLEKVAAVKLASMNQEILALSLGKLQFSRTETWRLVYEQILKNKDLGIYRSVAWVRCEAYWQDTPGIQSMESNYQAIINGIKIERIFIIPDSLLVQDGRVPNYKMMDWMLEQSSRGVEVRWVRESDLKNESDLVRDFGIYGQIAVGEQEMDERCRTLRFTLDFESRQVDLAQQRWKRLEIFSKLID